MALLDKLNGPNPAERYRIEKLLWPAIQEVETRLHKKLALTEFSLTFVNIDEDPEWEAIVRIGLGGGSSVAVVLDRDAQSWRLVGRFSGTPPLELRSTVKDGVADLIAHQTDFGYESGSQQMQIFRMRKGMLVGVLTLPENSVDSYLSFSRLQSYIDYRNLPGEPPLVVVTHETKQGASRRGPLTSTYACEVWAWDEARFEFVESEDEELKTSNCPHP